MPEMEAWINMRGRKVQLKDAKEDTVEGWKNR